MFETMHVELVLPGNGPHGLQARGVAMLHESEHRKLEIKELALSLKQQLPQILLLLIYKQ